jgi:hypothetical protein
VVKLRFSSRRCEKRIDHLSAVFFSEGGSIPFFLSATEWIASRSLSSGGALRRPVG